MQAASRSLSFRSAYTIMHDDTPEPSLCKAIPTKNEVELAVFATRELTKTCLRGIHIRLDDAFVPHPAGFRDKSIDEFVRNNRSILAHCPQSPVDLRAIVHSVVETHLRLNPAGGGNAAITDAICQRIREALASPR